jgi:hypothetical protein
VGDLVSDDLGDETGDGDADDARQERQEGIDRRHMLCVEGEHRHDRPTR